MFGEWDILLYIIIILYRHGPTFNYFLTILKLSRTIIADFIMHV